MRIGRLAIAGFALAIVPVFALPGWADSTPVIAVVPIQTDLVARDHIGRRQTGMLCGPDGGLVWRDADYSPVESQATAVAALRGATIIAVPDDQNATYRLEGKVVGVHLNACVAQRGRLVLLVGGRRTTKINGTVKLEWTVRDRARAAVKTIVDEETVHLASPDANLRQALEAAITASAAKLAPQIASLTP